MLLLCTSGIKPVRSLGNGCQAPSLINCRTLSITLARGTAIDGELNGTGLALDGIYLKLSRSFIKENIGRS